jgi:adenylate cyclase
MNEAATEEQLALVDAANRALNRYLERDFEGALGPLEDILALRPEDPSAEMMIASCKVFATRPPPPDWDGVRRMTTK